MIRELGSGPQGGEEFKDHLQPVGHMSEMMDNFYAILDRLLKKGKPDKTGRMEIFPNVIDGFEDILDGQPLGGGLFDNHTGSARQLIFALTISPNLEIAKIVDKGNPGNSGALIKQLRDKQVLSDLKIIDLGCGSGSFAVAAKTLGAEVYTADAVDLYRDRKALLNGHVVINFNDKDAASRLQRETGGNFDLVTENIIGHGWNEKVRLIPKEQFVPTIRRIAETLLKRGGYLYGDEFGMTTMFDEEGPFIKV